MSDPFSTLVRREPTIWPTIPRLYWPLRRKRLLKFWEIWGPTMPSLIEPSSRVDWLLLRRRRSETRRRPREMNLTRSLTTWTRRSSTNLSRLPRKPSGKYCSCFLRTLLVFKRSLGLGTVPSHFLNQDHSHVSVFLLPKIAQLLINPWKSTWKLTPLNCEFCLDKKTQT